MTTKAFKENKIDGFEEFHNFEPHTTGLTLTLSFLFFSRCHNNLDKNDDEIIFDAESAERPIKRAQMEKLFQLKYQQPEIDKHSHQANLFQQFEAFKQENNLSMIGELVESSVEER